MFLAKELGDVLYYLARAAASLGLTLSQVAQANVDKLRTRYPVGFSVTAAEAKADERRPLLADGGKLTAVEAEALAAMLDDTPCAVPEECGACQLRAHAERHVIRQGFDGNGSPTE